MGNKEIKEKVHKALKETDEVLKSELSEIAVKIGKKVWEEIEDEVLSNGVIKEDELRKCIFVYAMRVIASEVADEVADEVACEVTDEVADEVDILLGAYVFFINTFLELEFSQIYMLLMDRFYIAKFSRSIKEINTKKYKGNLLKKPFSVCYDLFNLEEYRDRINELFDKIESDEVAGKMFEAMDYVEKWGGAMPKERQYLLEYRKVKPRFELSNIYAEAERVEQENANETNTAKEIKTDTLDYPKGEITKSIYFGYNYSKEQINGVFDVLEERGYIESNERDNFCKVFTSRDCDELKDIRIVWLKNVTYLPILIRELADNIKNDEDKNIWVLAKLYFIKADGGEFDCDNMKAEASKSKQDYSSGCKMNFKEEIIKAIRKETPCK